MYDSSKRLNKVYGSIGEDLANKYLTQKGYKIVERNYKNRIGEIDIIALDKGVIVFVEVKYRHNDKFGMPREAVNKNKQFKIRQVATLYLKIKHKFDSKCRFDVIEILDDKITHLETCF